MKFALEHFFFYKLFLSISSFCFLSVPLFFISFFLRYVYELEASTGGGTGVSEKYVIQTPVSCPTGIKPPHSVSVSGPHSISLAWTPPGE